MPSRSFFPKKAKQKSVNKAVHCHEKSGDSLLSNAHLLDLGPLVPLGPVEEDCPGHEAGVEEDDHDDDGDDGALRAAHVARVPQILHKQRGNEVRDKERGMWRS